MHVFVCQWLSQKLVNNVSIEYDFHEHFICQNSTKGKRFVVLTTLMTTTSSTTFTPTMNRRWRLRTRPRRRGWWWVKRWWESRRKLTSFVARTWDQQSLTSCKKKQVYLHVKKLKLTNAISRIRVANWDYDKHK